MNYKKYSLIFIGVILLVVVYGRSNGVENVYAYSDPQQLQLEEQVFDSTSDDIEIVLQEDGYISQLYATDEFVYYLCEPRLADTTRDVNKDLAYIKKVNILTGEVQTLRKFSNMGKFDIIHIVYGKDYCFIKMVTFEGNNIKHSILKMDNKTGDISVVYEKTSVNDDEYAIINVDIDSENKYLIWNESYRDTNKNNYKVYDIEKDEITTHKFQKNTYKYYTSLTVNENVVVYNVINKNRDNIIVCETIDDGEVSEIRKINIHKGNFSYGEYNDDYLVWEGDIEGDDFGDFDGNAYLFDFNTGEQFIIDERIVLYVKLYDDYIVYSDDEYIYLIDYRNKEKQNYLIKEEQQLINVTNNYIVLEEYIGDGNGTKVVYKNINN